MRLERAAGVDQSRCWKFAILATSTFGSSCSIWECSSISFLSPMLAKCRHSRAQRRGVPRLTVRLEILMALPRTLALLVFVHDVVEERAEDVRKAICTKLTPILVAISTKLPGTMST